MMIMRCIIIYKQLGASEAICYVTQLRGVYAYNS